MDDCLVSVGCCQVEVSAMSRSTVQVSPTECGVSEFDVKPHHRGGPGPLGTVVP